MSEPILPYPSQITELTLPLGPLRLWQPASSEALLDAMADAPPDPDDKMPYWADLWPSAVGLAEAIEAGDVPLSGPVMELGAGLGLVGLSAARVGVEAAVSDWIDESLCYVRESAALNGVSLETMLVDWRQPPPRRWPTLLAADVLYEARNGPILHGAIDAMLAPGGVAWIADPGRDHVPAFLECLSGWSVERTLRPVQSPHIPNGRATIRLYRLTRL